ncbi:hypothetical protein DFQ26_005935 [Actinomortierella ambigua]|nr:hypothetical protein DFQ26_005935 [Actinomortierella ambigua]
MKINHLSAILALTTAAALANASTIGAAQGGDELQQPQLQRAADTASGVAAAVAASGEEAPRIARLLRRLVDSTLGKEAAAADDHREPPSVIEKEGNDNRLRVKRGAIRRSNQEQQQQQQQQQQKQQQQKKAPQPAADVKADDKKKQEPAVAAAAASDEASKAQQAKAAAPAAPVEPKDSGAAAPAVAKAPAKAETPDTAKAAAPAAPKAVPADSQPDAKVDAAADKAGGKGPVAQPSTPEDASEIDEREKVAAAARAAHGTSCESDFEYYYYNDDNDYGRHVNDEVEAEDAAASESHGPSIFCSQGDICSALKLTGVESKDMTKVVQLFSKDARRAATNDEITVLSKVVENCINNMSTDESAPAAGEEPQTETQKPGDDAKGSTPPQSAKPQKQ